MRKFWVIFFTIFVTCAIGISMIVMFATRETIKISADVMYVNVGDTFNLSLEQTNAKDSTKITGASSDSSIVSFNNGLCVAKAGGVARITFTTTNASYRSLYCDIMVGDGSQENPFYISSAEQFASIGKDDSVYTIDSCFKLVNNIDVSNINNGYWAPIEKFSGIFDGNGYIINNINIDKLSFIDNNPEVASHIFDNAGLFGIISANGKVCNLKLDNFTATGEYTNIGAIAGINNGVIERVEVKNAIFDVDSSYIGGITGRNISTEEFGTRVTATIDKSSANVIMGQKQVLVNDTVQFENVGITGIIGGIAGQNIGGKLSNIYSTGKVVLGESGIVYGGLVGDNQFNVFTSADENTNSYVSGGKIKDGYSAISLYTAKVSSISKEVVGGVVGQNNDAIETIATEGSSIVTNTNNLTGLYYDKEMLNVTESATIKRFDGIGKNLITENTAKENNLNEKAGYVLGYTSNDIKKPANLFSGDRVTETYSTDGELLTTKTEKTMWDFNYVWQVNADINNGYPYLTYLYVEESNESNSDYFYSIVNKYQLTIAQGDAKTEEATKYISTITIKNADNEVVKKSTSAEVTIDIPEGFKVMTSGNQIVIYDLEGKAYYTITFVISNSNYKFDNIETSYNITENNGQILSDSTITCWFKNTNHTLTFIDANTGKTIRTSTVSEGTTLTSYINYVTNQYSKYNYIRYNTEMDGTGVSYTSSNKMPSDDLILYVIYSDTTIDYPYEDDGDNNDYSENTYEIYNTDTWNQYVVNYGDDEDITFVQTKNFTIDSDFKACDVFAGTYNGNGYTITVKGTVKNFSLFNEVESGALIKELDVKYSSVTFRSVNDSEYFGAIANISNGAISDCNVSGTINIGDLDLVGVAGVVGLMESGNVTDCYNTANITAKAQLVAGIVSAQKKGTISDCVNSGTITNNSSSISDYSELGHGTANAAGIVGYMYGSYSKTVSNNTNIGKIESKVAGNNDGANAAGIVGYMTYGTVSNNSNSGAIISDYQSAGIVAYVCGGTVKTNTNTGNITAETTESKCNVAAGGIVAKTTNGTISSNKHNKGNITAKTNKYNDSQAYAGGIIGCMFGGKASSNVMNCLAYITSVGAYAYGAGGCGRVNSGTFSSNSYVTNWRAVHRSYLTVSGTKSYLDYNAIVG